MNDTTEATLDSRLAKAKDRIDELEAENERLWEVKVILEERIAALADQKGEDGALPPKDQGFREGLESAVAHFERAEARIQSALDRAGDGNQ